MNAASVNDHEDEDTCDDEVDPRIKEELESLNFASEEINKLERELDLSRNTFRHVLSESSSTLNALQKKLGKCVTKTRPYYDLLKSAKQAQSDAQHAALRFQRSISEHRAAKAMVTKAEETLISPAQSSDGKHRQFDSAWQEMLNQATIKLMDSEKERTQSEADHLSKSAQYGDVQKQLRVYESDLNKSIQKAKPFFELKEKRELQLGHEKINVEDLVRALSSAKQRYRDSLTQLEKISEQIHEQRNHTLNMLPLRTPGVGAENEDLPPIHFDIQSISSADTCSLQSSSSDMRLSSISSLENQQPPSTEEQTENFTVNTAENSTVINTDQKLDCEGSADNSIPSHNQPHISITRTPMKIAAQAVQNGETSSDVKIGRVTVNEVSMSVKQLDLNVQSPMTLTQPCPDVIKDLPVDTTRHGDEEIFV